MPELALNGVMMITARAETRVSPRRMKRREKPFPAQKFVYLWNQFSHTCLVIKDKDSFGVGIKYDSNAFCCNHIIN